MARPDLAARCLREAATCRVFADYAVCRLVPNAEARADAIAQARSWIAWARTWRAAAPARLP